MGEEDEVTMNENDSGELKGVAKVDAHIPVESQESLAAVVDNFRDFLVEKNKRYENSASEPIGIFTKFMRWDDSLARSTILVRLDDKMKRIVKSGKDGKRLRKNDVSDLVGYLILLMREEGWHSFEDLLD